MKQILFLIAVTLLSQIAASAKAEELPGELRVTLNSSNLWGMKIKTFSAQDGTEINALHVAFMASNGQTKSLDFFLGNDSNPHSFNVNFAGQLAAEIRAGATVKIQCQTGSLSQRIYCSIPNVIRAKEYRFPGPGRFIVPPKNTEAFHYIYEF